jgi:hypothetical protein
MAVELQIRPEEVYFGPLQGVSLRKGMRPEFFGAAPSEFVNQKKYHTFYYIIRY